MGLDPGALVESSIGIDGAIESLPPPVGSDVGD